MKHALKLIAALAIAGFSLVAFSGPASARTPSKPGAEEYIISPKDGDTVTSPVTIVFGLKGMGVAPAGVAKAGTGHHHLLIDTDLPPLDRPIPADEHHRHFGGGQTQVTLDLAPGKHTLQLLLGDQNHIPHDPAVYSKKIMIMVK
ncbi:DUF4399 domain-containing protein [Kordiimonas marina]|uniref:DUF4399 domain-containing protein n=1 Tax=Kordiimonas marina TaxID=2872312 RepID=UPI001FF6C55E|nr:DUF4399 domain-containing protein [Kordiimonas marina]MCJ9428899.1 DUF4399 domain-containing protein [Kordiimonas marina]